MQSFRLIAILGSSGSGKTKLGLELCQKLDCEIFSLDSLSIYQEIDIASAKPTPQELSQTHHYGINILQPIQTNNAMLFRNLLLDAIQTTQNKGKQALLIVGGSSFYLKSIIDGLSKMPELDSTQKTLIQQQIQTLNNPCAFLQKIDPALPINPNDSYRIYKALELYFATKIPPTQYFLANPPLPFPHRIEKYCIALERGVLREKIHKRTQEMFKLGILEETQGLVEKYGYRIWPMGSIGLKECVEFLTQTPLDLLQGKSPTRHTQIAKNQKELIELISIHTAQLAKRQNTFNKHQFGTLLTRPPKFKDGNYILWASSEELLGWI